MSGISMATKATTYTPSKGQDLLLRLHLHVRQAQGRTSRFSVKSDFHKSWTAQVKAHFSHRCSTNKLCRIRPIHRILSFGSGGAYIFRNIGRHTQSLSITNKLVPQSRILFAPGLCCRLLNAVVSGSFLYYLSSRRIQFVQPAQCSATCDTPFISNKQLINDQGRHWKNSLQWLVRDFIPLGVRAIQLLCFFTPLLITFPLTYLGPKWFDGWLWLMYIAVEYSGATFIKLGQWASTRRDLFSKQVCDRFAHLHFQVRPHAWSHTARTLQEAFGDDWQQLLHLRQGQKPIGSGCIAQVYKGHISAELGTPSGDVSICAGKGSSNPETSKAESETSHDTADVIPVAIKVLHPNVQAKFKRDMILMAWAARSLTWLFPKLHWVNLNQCVQEFKVVMEAQLDMRQECLSLQGFTKNFASCDQIGVPKPFPHLVKHNILVETFEEGISVGEIVQDSGQSPELKEQLANIGVHALLQMVFVNNFVHADLHPGNLLVQNMDNFTVPEDTAADGIEEAPEDYRSTSHEGNLLRLVLLDCGITASLEPEDEIKFREVFTAVVKGEGEIVADLFLAKSAINKCKDPALFRREMAQLVKDARQDLVNISKIKVAELMNSVFSVLARHEIQLEANFATIILAMAMLEGLGRSLKPDLDLLDKARPVLLDSYMSGRRASA